tara:strand:+ start:3649 stop:3879 length:231 start_codon:yes stop_codon:yes gene_type:complete
MTSTLLESLQHAVARQGEPAPVYGLALGHDTYERHRPEQTLLYQLIEKHYPAPLWPSRVYQLKTSWHGLLSVLVKE